MNAYLNAWVKKNRKKDIKIKDKYVSKCMNRLYKKNKKTNK